MERIEALINKLKEQFAAAVDPSQLMMTVQLLHHELTKLKANKPQQLGTPKVAVIMPQVMSAFPEQPQYEKYAPRPADAPKVSEKPAIQESKETVLVDNGSLSVVQKNGQLDMVFDPMTEIPTLFHQPKEKELNDGNATQESLNDKLKQGKTELVEVLKETPVKDLRKAIGINDRYLFISDLFRGDESTYERSIKTINSFNIYAEAEYWISRELKTKIGWDNNNPTVQLFDQLVKRRFS